MYLQWICSYTYRYTLYVIMQVRPTILSHSPCLLTSYSVQSHFTSLSCLTSYSFIVYGERTEAHDVTNKEALRWARQSCRMICISVASFPYDFTLTVDDVHEGRQGRLLILLRCCDKLPSIISNINQRVYCFAAFHSTT